MFGFYGRIINIDLTHQTFTIEALADDIYSRYIGGKGLAAHLLTELNPPQVDPMAPENCLIFATGPLGGSTIWGSCRYGVYTKSPLTGIFAESYCGGRTPDAIDATGFDAVVIRGASQIPAVLTVHPDGVVFHEATDLWGLETYVAEDTLKARFAYEKYRKKGAVVIGPAGENQVRFAVIENDYWRSAGRAGVGTVMGSKRLKGILFTGDRKRSHADEKGVKALTKAFMAEFNDHAAANAYRTLGTPMLVKMTNQVNAFPTRYWTKGSFENWEKISAEAVIEKMDPDMVDSCQEKKVPSVPTVFQRSFSWLCSKAPTEAQPVLRRLITLIFAGWLPHDLASSRSCLGLSSGVRPKKRLIQ
jgi:aldehyde:ferredoxin oxidoreductase